MGTELAAIADFQADLKEHQASDEVLVLVFTEFGRRVKDNGSGTDHGSGGAAFVIGDRVSGGMHGVYPPLRGADLLDGDLYFQVDFRSVYSTIIDKWLGLDSRPVVGGNFEHLNFLYEHGREHVRHRGICSIVPTSVVGECAVAGDQRIGERGRRGARAN